MKQFEKSQSQSSLQSQSTRKKSGLVSADVSIEEEAKEKLETSSPATPPPALTKKLTNLKDFYALPGQSAPEAEAGVEAGGVVTSPCAEAANSPDTEDPFDWVGYSQANSALAVYCK